MKYIEGLMLSILAIFLPIKALIIAVLVLTLGDLITGIWVAIKNKEPITSAGLRRSISKIVVYELCLLLGYVAEHYLIGDLLPVSKLLAGMVGAVEMKSILENANIIGGVDIFKSLIDKLGSVNQS